MSEWVTMYGSKQYVGLPSALTLGSGIYISSVSVFVIFVSGISVRSYCVRGKTFICVMVCHMSLLSGAVRQFQSDSCFYTTICS
jgi:hypothetical protein